MYRLLCAAFVMFDTNLSQTDSKSFHTKQAGHIWLKFFMSTVINKLTYRMVTLVSFLLTIFTKFRPLKTNLQALCCLTERIKKGKPTIKVTAEVFSRGLLQRAPAEPWTEAPAGATGVPQPGSAGWQRTARDERAAGAAQPQPATTRHMAPKALPGQGGSRIPEQRHTRCHTSHRSCNGARGQPLWPTVYLQRKITAPRKMSTGK